MSLDKYARAKRARAKSEARVWVRVEPSSLAKTGAHRLDLSTGVGV